MQGVQSLAQAGQNFMGDEYAGSPERKEARKQRRGARKFEGNFSAYQAGGGKLGEAAFNKAQAGTFVGKTLKDAFGALKSVGGTLFNPLLSLFGVSGIGSKGG